MRVVTWNIHHGAPGHRRRVDLVGVAAALHTLDADVVGLQEVDRCTWRSWGVDQAAALAGSLGVAHHFGAARPLVWGGSYGNALLVRGRVVDAVTHALPTRGEPRAVVVATVRVPGTSAAAVTVAATHLQHRRGAPEREAPGQLRAALAHLEERSGPAVLVGDLNLEGPEVEEALAAAGFVGVVSGPTFPASRPRRRPDHVAVRDASVRAVDVPDVGASDHRPVVVDLDV